MSPKLDHSLSHVALTSSLHSGITSILPIREEVNLVAFVVIDEGESLESALKRFKRRVQQEAIIKEIKKHSVYFKPGERKRMKEAQARKRMRRRMKREKDFEY